MRQHKPRSQTYQSLVLRRRELLNTLVGVRNLMIFEHAEDSVAEPGRVGKVVLVE